MEHTGRSARHSLIVLPLAALAALYGCRQEDPKESTLDLSFPDDRVKLSLLTKLDANAAAAQAETIAKLARSEKPNLAREAVKALIRAKAWDRLASMPPPRDAMARRLVCRQFTEHPGIATFAELKPYLGDHNPEIRAIAAANTIRLLKGLDQPNLGPVRLLLKRDDTGTRLSAVTILGAVSPVDLVLALKDKSSAVADLALDKLVEAHLWKPLVPLLAGSGAQRTRAATGLARMGRHSELAGLDADPDPAVRLAASYGAETRGVPGPLRLLITIDTLRADALGCYGSPFNTSAHIDRLSRSANIYEAARTQSTWTLAAHTAIFTSNYPSAYGIRDVSDALPQKATTIAERFREQGFMTAAITSVPYLTRSYGMGQGFHWLESRPDQPASMVTRKAVPLLRSFRRITQSPKPAASLFLFLHYFDPHRPYRPPARWLARFGLVPTRAYDMRRPESLGPLGLGYLRTAYQGEVASTDEAIGGLLAWLRKLRCSDVRIVMAADHGEEFGDHGHFGHGWTLYAEQQRVPLLVSRIPREAGVLQPRPIRLLDTASLFSAGAPASPEAGHASDGPTPLVSFAESHFKGATLASIVVGLRYKLIRKAGKLSLFDLERDPAERTDLATSRPQTVKALARLLAAEAVRPPATKTSADMSPETVRSLESLGYLD